jgi:hypothetical protein
MASDRVLPLIVCGENSLSSLLLGLDESARIVIENVVVAANLLTDLLGLPRYCCGTQIHLYKISLTSDNPAPLGCLMSKRN